VGAQVSDSQDWTALYAGLLAGAGIPAARAPDAQQVGQMVVRDLVVDLGEVRDRAVAAGARVVSVFADVVHMPADADWTLVDRGLLLHTRRLVATTGRTIHLDTRAGHQDARISIVATEIEGPLAITVSTDDVEASSVDLSSFAGLGVRIWVSDGAVQRAAVARLADEDFAVGAPLWMSLATGFQVATLLVDSQPGTAAGIANWVQAATANCPAALDLHLQALSLGAGILARTSSVPFVPLLSRETYKQVVSSLTEAVVLYEGHLRDLHRDATDAHARVAAAKNLQAQYAAALAYDSQLLAQAQDNVAAAAEATTTARQRFAVQSTAVDIERVTLKTGIELWKHQMILDAITSFGTALITFVASIAAMAIGDEAAAPAAGGAITSAAKAAKEVTDIGAAVEGFDAQIMGGGLLDLVAQMTKLWKVVDSFKKLTEFLDHTAGLLTTIIPLTSDLSAVGGFDHFSLPSFDDISADAEWEAFRVTSGGALAGMIKLGIDGAEQYHEALDKLVIYGKSLTAAQAAYLTSMQELAGRVGQLVMHQKLEAAITSEIVGLANSAQVDDTLATMLALRGLGLRQSLYLAKEGYSAAYRYWAMRPSQVTLSIAAPAEDLQADVATLDSDWANALTTFGTTRLQDFGSPASVTVEVDDPRVLDLLRSTMSAQIEVGLDDDAFHAFDRVRVGAMRVWLYGATHQRDVSILVSSSGDYCDRYHGHDARFVAEPLTYAFAYAGDAGDETRIRVMAAPAHETGAAYFQPTPFTQWRIELPARDNAGLDLSGLSRITLAFSGTMVRRA
jgi:hypothetical protein